MTFTEALQQIPIMFYVCLLLLPFVMVAYFIAGKQRKVISLRQADPTKMLEPVKINAGKIIVNSGLLGLVWGLAFSLVIFFGMIFLDWYNSTGLFAKVLPYSTFPPAVVDNYPAQPPSYEKKEPASAPVEKNKN